LTRKLTPEELYALTVMWEECGPAAIAREYFRLEGGFRHPSTGLCVCKRKLPQKRGRKPNVYTKQNEFAVYAMMVEELASDQTAYTTPIGNCVRT
jgi:hypothetical protein